MVVGALLGCVRRLSLPSLLACPAPLPCPQSSSPCHPSRRSPSSECANARPTMYAGVISLLPIRSHRYARTHSNAPHCGGSLFPRFPSLRGSPSLRSRSPRHARHPLCALRYAARARHACRRAGDYVVGGVVGALLICSPAARIRTNHRAKRSTPFGIMGRAQIVSGRIIASAGCRGRSPFFEKTGGEETFISLRRERQKK